MLPLLLPAAGVGGLFDLFGGKKFGTTAGGWLSGISKGVQDFVGGPKTPDFTGAAEKQAAAGQQAVNAQTQANRANTSTAFGGTQWSQDPTTGQWTMSNQFAPGMQQSVDLAQQQLADALRGGLPTGEQARDQAINAAYGQASSRLDPAFDQREAQLRSRLANQGLDPTSQAYQTELVNFGRDRNDAYTSAMNSAIGQGTQAGNMLFQQSLQRQQQPLGLLGGMQGLQQQPGYHAAGMAPTPDYLSALGMQNQSDLFRWKQQQGLFGDVLKTGGQVLGAL